MAKFSARGAWRLVPALLLLAGMEFAPRPAHPTWNAVFDSGHAVLFGAVALVFLRWLRSAGVSGWKSYGIALLAAAATGAASEALQFPGPRDADPRDLERDVLGAVGFLGVAAVLDTTLRRGAFASRALRALVGFLAICVTLGGFTPVLLLGAREIRREALFPTVYAFSSVLDLRFLGLREVTLERVPWSGEEGKKNALRVTFLPSRYPGIMINDPPKDWRGFRELAFEVYSESDTTITLLVRVEDEAHDDDYYDRFNGVVGLDPGENAVRFPLEDIAGAPRSRAMDLSRMKRVTLFLDSPRAPISIIVGALRLVR